MRRRARSPGSRPRRPRETCWRWRWPAPQAISSAWSGRTNQRVDAHHIVSWLTGGRTDISNLVLLCHFHHGLIHDHGYRIDWVNGNLEFHRPDGAPIPQAAPPSTGTLEHLVESHTAQQLEITSDSLTSTWNGETLDPDPVLLRLLTKSAESTAA